MRFTTIWTWPGLPLKERLERTKEAFWRGLAHRLPRKLAYWSYVDTGARFIARDEVVPDVRYTEIFERMATDQN